MKVISKTFPYRVRSLDRAIDILDGFTFQTRHMTLSEVVRKTGLNITTAKRLISNLTQRGYLRQDSATKRYTLGLRLFELGGIVFSSNAGKRIFVEKLQLIERTLLVAHR